MKRATRAAQGVLVIATVAMALSGCGSTARGAAAPTTVPVSTTRLMPTTPNGAPGPVVTVPTEGNGSVIEQAFDAGQQILVEPGSFWPNILVADIKVPITWTNLTTTPQQISFLFSTVKSPLIPPGGKWSYTAENGVNIHYVDKALNLQSTVDFNGS